MKKILVIGICLLTVLSGAYAAPATGIGGTSSTEVFLDLSTHADIEVGFTKDITGHYVNGAFNTTPSESTSNQLVVGDDNTASLATNLYVYWKLNTAQKVVIRLYEQNPLNAGTYAADSTATADFINWETTGGTLVTTASGASTPELKVGATTANSHLPNTYGDTQQGEVYTHAATVTLAQDDGYRQLTIATESVQGKNAKRFSSYLYLVVAAN